MTQTIPHCKDHVSQEMTLKDVGEIPVFHQFCTSRQWKINAKREPRKAWVCPITGCHFVASADTQSPVTQADRDNKHSLFLREHYVDEA